jgi:hypothetical protein
MSNYVFLYDAIHVTPSIPEAEVAPLIADGTYVRVENDDPRGEPGYVARRPDAIVGVFVFAHHDEDGVVSPAGITIEADWHVEIPKAARTADAVAAEVAQIVADFRFRAADRAPRRFDGVIAYDDDTDPKVIVIRDGRPVVLTDEEWQRETR